MQYANLSYLQQFVFCFACADVGHRKKFLAIGLCTTCALFNKHTVVTSHHFERLSRSTFFFGVLVLFYYISLCSLLYFYPKPKLNAFEFVLVQGQNEQMAATVPILFCVKQRRCETYLTHLRCCGVICFWLL